MWNDKNVKKNFMKNYIYVYCTDIVTAALISIGGGTGGKKKL